MNERCSQRLIGLFKVTWLVSSRAGTEFKSSDSGPGLFALTLSEGKRKPPTYECPSLGLEFSIQPEIIEEERQTHTFFIKFNSFAFCDSIAYSLSLSPSLSSYLSFPLSTLFLFSSFFKGLKKHGRPSIQCLPHNWAEHAMAESDQQRAGSDAPSFPGQPQESSSCQAWLSTDDGFFFFFFYKGEKTHLS